MPVLRARPIEEAAKDAADTVSDPRTLDYVDTKGVLSQALTPVLELPPSIPAWDVYLVYGPEARWPEDLNAPPPAPNYWMHQLWKMGPPGLRLDPAQLNFVVSGMLLKMGK